MDAPGRSPAAADPHPSARRDAAGHVRALVSRPRQRQRAQHGSCCRRVSAPRFLMLAYRATRMFEQQPGSSAGSPPARLPSCSPSPPSTACARPSGLIARSPPCAPSPTAPRARSDAGHLPPLPRGADRAEAVLAWARRLWGLMSDPTEAVPLEHDVYLKLWHLDGARLPPGAEVLYLDEAQDANPVTLAVLEAQGRPPVWVGGPWQSV